MIVLSAKELSKQYGTDVILSDISFHANKGDKIGIVGVNGAGKTTLFSILNGDMPSDSGEFYISGNLRVGYFKQRDNLISGETVLQAMAQVDGYEYDSEVTAMLSAMSFSEDMYDRPVNRLSGGEEARLALGCILLSKPDILMLDEPTNHLDLETIKKLENYIRGYKGTVLIVSHDRYFLDRTVNKILELSCGHGRMYNGSYSFYAKERKAVRATELKAYNKQQSEIRRQEDMIRKFKERGTEKLAKRAASREKLLAGMEKRDKPETVANKMKMGFKENFPSGQDVLIGENISVGFTEPLFSGLDFLIKRGDRVAILGANGIGKTTLLRAIIGELPVMEGRIKLGHNVTFGYYDQGQKLLDYSNTVIEEVHEDFRLYSEGEIRNLLAGFLFKGDDVFLRVGDLSGGEKARLALLKLMMGGANVLVIDEPTNHLDIDSKEAFEDALLEYPGTLIVVSHDRYFLSKVPNKTINLNRYRQSNSETIEGALHDAESLSEAQISRKERKRQQAKMRRRERQMQALELKIQELEGDIECLEQKLLEPDIALDFQQLASIASEIQTRKTQLDGYYEEWMELE